ncbi:Cupin 1 [Zalerion maritima]|uniref:Signal recognition particle subunit SRP14 n=1 Tax=Zalerion maritima TaxID=339359 RepID=A0AAD5RPV2_9PEZI|nr:Cupin 1 [Zalerion maritima]
MSRETILGDTWLIDDLRLAQFFTRLAEVFASYKDKDHGSVFLSQKRCASILLPRTPSTLAYDQNQPTEPPEPLPILIRATNGHSKSRRNSKIKLSTVVQPTELPGFFARYAEVCKTGMVALKPRDRSKRKEKLKKRKKAAKEES